MPHLKCPCCHQELVRKDKVFLCPNNHSFDIAKKNYVNLLLANQGHHEVEGDSKEMIEARKRFLSTGHYAMLQKALIAFLSSLNLPQGSCFTDIACGEGYYTNAIHQALGYSSIGIDISKAAVISSSSSRNQLGLKNIDYVIGNLDYLPLMDASQDVLLNCFAPINESEFLRVCKSGGYYLRVLPDVDHLWGMKEVLYEEVRPNEPKEKEMPGFTLVKEEHIQDEILLSSSEIADLFTMTPYYYKTSPEAKQKLYALKELKTKISFVLRLYQKN